MKTLVFSLGLMAVLLTSTNLNAQYDGSRGLFGLGKSAADYEYSYSNRDGLMNISGNSSEGISNYGIGEEVPMGSGLLILSLAGVGYAALRRKRSRKGTALLLACVLLLSFTQCKKEQPVEPTQNEGVRITLTVDGGNNNGSRVIVNPTGHTNPNFATVTFEAGDVIYVGNNGAYCGYLEYDGTTNKFSGNIDDSNLSEADYLHFYFMGNKGAKSQPTSVNITDQTSKYPVISYAHSKTLYNSEVSTYTAKLQNYCAIVKFTTPDISQTNAITITGMNNTVTVNFSANNAATSATGDPYSFSAGNGEITLHAESNTERWAILIPKNTAITSTAFADGYAPNGTFTVPAITANTYYGTGISVSMTEVKFSVGENTKVLFAPGNLQAKFTATGTSSCTWQFAPTQYSYIGNATANTAIGNNQVSNTGTVDLFGWVGTGSKLAAYGINNSTTDGDYASSTDEELKYDWGMAASGLGGHTDWRTLTKDEWNYLFNERTDHDKKYGHGSVNGENGMIILPDNWTLPTGLTFTSGNSAWTNSYTIAQWDKMEKNGAVFLPAAGYRNGTTVANTGSYGYYWSSTSHASWRDNVHIVKFDSGESYTNGSYTGAKRLGYSVRLVRTVN